MVQELCNHTENAKLHCFIVLECGTAHTLLLLVSGGAFYYCIVSELGRRVVTGLSGAIPAHA